MTQRSKEQLKRQRIVRTRKERQAIVAGVVHIYIVCMLFVDWLLGRIPDPRPVTEVSEFIPVIESIWPLLTLYVVWFALDLSFRIYTEIEFYTDFLGGAHERS